MNSPSPLVIPPTNIRRARSSTSDPMAFAGEVSVSVNNPSSAGSAQSVADNPDTRLAEMRIVAPAAPASVSIAVDTRTKPIQIWEGVVSSVDHQKRTMTTKLRARMNVIPEHSATFDLEWVPDQDQDLVVPGAVFYLILYRKLNKSTVQNSQELRFRRIPNWTNQQIRNIHKAAKALEAGITIARTVD